MSAPKIRRLPDTLVSQIAAGEVVERPASVVKELIENAIDAGATRVRVQIDAGGTREIVVSDDGVGMSPEDARLALERHTTSKFININDFDTLHTFGFRGEALPSIASVARLTLTTRARDAESAVKLLVEGGRTGPTEPEGAAVGTSVRVADLFFNVPARKKFLKSIPTEAAHVSDVLASLAMAHPGVGFELWRDGRLSKEHPKGDDMATRARRILADPSLVEARGARGPLTWHALLTTERYRSGATGLYLFVNHRSVRDRLLAKAVAQAYGPHLGPGRYPTGVLFVELPNPQVDVNVHPQKLEVRFRDARAVVGALISELTPHLARALPEAPPANEAHTSVSPSRPRAAGHQALGRTSAATETNEPRVAQLDGEPRGLAFIGTTAGGHIVCESAGSLVVVDPHALSERAAAAAWVRELRAGNARRRSLREPRIVEMDPASVSAVDTHSALCNRLGFELDLAGRDALTVRGVPAALRGDSALVRALGARLSDGSPPPADAPIASLGDLLAPIACAGASPHGTRLSTDAIERCLGGIHGASLPFRLHHERIILARLPLADLEGSDRAS